MNLLPFLSIFVAIFLGLVITLMALSGTLYAYHIKLKSIDVVLFGCWVAYEIPFDDTEDVQKVSRNEIKPDLQTMRIGNSLSNQKVLIKRRSGKFTKIVLTPPDAKVFIRQLDLARNTLP